MLPQSQRKTLVAITCAAMTQHGIVMLLTGALLPEIMKTFQIREAAAGLMLLAGAIGFAVGPLLAGILSDHTGPKAIFIVGLAAEVVLLVVFSLTSSAVPAAAVYFALLLAASFIETPVNIIPAVVAKDNPGPLMSIVHMFFSVGAFASPFMAGVLFHFTGSWRPVYWVAAGLTAALLLIFWRTRFPDHKPAWAVERAAEAASRPKESAWTVLRERAILLGALAMLLYVASEFGASNWITLYMQKQLGFGTLVATSALSILWLGLLLGRLANSRLAVRWSSHTLVLWSGGLGLVTGLGLLTARSPLPAYAWTFALGLCMAGVYPNIMADLNGRNPERVGLITGFVAQAAAAGSALAQPTLGVLAERVSLPVAISLVGILMGLVAVVTYFELPHRHAAAGRAKGEA